MLFDVNDFDETLPGPWEWDVKRLAASVVIAARDREFTDAEARTAAVAVGSGYRTEMRRLATLSTLDVWYSHIDVTTLLQGLQESASSGSKTARRMAERTAKTVAKARTRTVCRPSTSSPPWSTASAGSSAIHRCSCPWPRCSPMSRARPSWIR